MSNPNATPEEQAEIEESQADAYFDEFSGDDTPAAQVPEHDEREGSYDDGPPRDGQGRFAGADNDGAGESDGQSEGQGEHDGGESPDDELERLRQESQKWQHRYHSDLGRQNALQRKIQQLEEQNQQLQSQPAATSSKGQQGQQGKEGENPAGSGMSDEDWENLKQDFPEIARGVEHQLSQVQKQYDERIKQLESQLTPIQQQAEQQAFQAEMSTLDQQHPDWRETVNKPEFQDWLQQQPPGVQKMVESDSAAEAAYLIGTFKNATGAAQASQPGNADLRQRRQRNLQSARSVPSRGGRQRSAIPDDDEDALFDYFADKG